LRPHRVDEGVVEVDRHLAKDQSEMADRDRRHGPGQDGLEGVMGPKATLPLASKEGVDEHEHQEEVAEGHGQVKHRLQGRIVGQRTGREGRDVVGAQQVGLHQPRHRARDIVDEVGEEARHQS